MGDATYYLLALLLAVVLAWQAITGVTGAVWWWKPRITRWDEPAVFWAVLAAQLAILVLFLVTGRSWHIRQ